MNDISIKERYTAILIGCAIGDTLGMPVEGWKREQIQKYVGRIEKPIGRVVVKDGEGNIVREDEFGRIKLYHKDREAGQFTDDTVLTLALAESLAEKGFDLSDAVQKHLEYYHNYPGRGYGLTTQEGMANLEKGISPTHSGIIGGPGNGPSMKMSPVGMYMHAKKIYLQGLRYAEKVGKMTHQDPRSIIGGVIQANAVWDLLNGCSRQRFIENAEYNCSKEIKASEKFPLHEQTMKEKILWIKDHIDADDEEAYHTLKCSSLVWESHPFALFMFQKYWDKPLEGLLKTVNYGGDCDTTGAIVGTLIGAKDGMIFPKEWIDVLEDKSKIIKIGETLGDLK